MRSFRRLVAAFLSAALLASLTVAPTFAGGGPNTWWVDDDFMGTAGNCNSSGSLPLTIQEAIDTASAGDTIMVCPGTYLGKLTVATNNLTIRSVKYAKAVIEPAADHVPDTDLVTIQDADGVVLRGFRIRVPTGGSCEYVNAMVAVSNSPNTIIRGNRLGITGTEGLGGCGYVTGVQVSSASGGTKIQRNRITDFQANGVYVIGSGTVTINRNRINFLHAAYGAQTGANGIYANPTGGNAVIRDNTVLSLPTGGVSTPRLSFGIYVSGGGSVEVKGNVGRYLFTYIYVLGAGSGVVTNNRGVLGIQRGLDYNVNSNTEVAYNRMSATEVGVDVDTTSIFNNFHDNDWTGPSGNDCYDSSSGGGTANTSNTWTNNLGGESNPPGICTAAP